jgi:hypothetical protein
MSTDFFIKCNLLAQVYLETRVNEEAKPFGEVHDVGLPMAYLQNEGLVSIKTKGKKYIEETWISFCNTLEIPPDDNYRTMEDIDNAVQTFELGKEAKPLEE